MNKKSTPSFGQLDKQFVWHPFTQMREWLAADPIVIASGNGPFLRDTQGRRYLDANSSIWTNLHGHNHPTLNAAIEKQLRHISHSSYLGLANQPASLLAAALVNAAQPVGSSGRKSIPVSSLTKVFFSDDGSTAMEVALKMAFEYSRRTGFAKRPRFLSLDSAYHGDTIGAVSLGHIDLFHAAYSPLLFKSDKAMAPYCYRCPFNRAKPQRADARVYRRCGMECLAKLEDQFKTARRQNRPYSGFVVEPLVQGAAGMIAQPRGWLSGAARLARDHGALLIADEVMTGFCRTGPMLACHKENVTPDLMALAKGLTGGYLPMAATLTTQTIFDAFLGDYDEFKTFFHGHSYTGNQLGASAALASLELLQKPGAADKRRRLATALARNLKTLWRHPNVGDIRQEGLIAGVELVRDWRTRQPFDLRERAGLRVCQAMAKHGVLTRPIGNVLVLMPPYCCTEEQTERIVETLSCSIQETLEGSR